MKRRSEIDNTLGDCDLSYLDEGRDQLHRGYSDQNPPMDAGGFGRARRNANGSEYTAYETEMEPSLGEQLRSLDEHQEHDGFIERPGNTDGLFSRTDVERN